MGNSACSARAPCHMATESWPQDWRCIPALNPAPCTPWRQGRLCRVLGARGRMKNRPTCVIASVRSFSFLAPAPPPATAARPLQCDRTTVCTALRAGSKQKMHLMGMWRRSEMEAGTLSQTPNTSCKQPCLNSGLTSWCHSGTANRLRTAAPSSALPAAGMTSGCVAKQCRE